MKGAQTMMNKGISALAALAFCVILTACFFPFSQPQTTEDCAITLIEPITKPQKGIFPNEVPYEIIPVVYIPTPNDELTSAPQTTEESEAISPKEIPSSIISEPSQTVCDTPVVIINDRPEPPVIPGAATLADVEAHKALDPALTNPNVKPDGTPVTVAPPVLVNYANQEPNTRTTNNNDDVYVPGFGWIPNSGESHGQPSGSDGDWNKIIGSRGN